MKDEDLIMLLRMIDMRLVIDGFEKEAIGGLLKIYTDGAKAINSALLKVTNTDWTNDRLRALLFEVQGAADMLIARVADETASAVSESGAYAYRKMNDIVSWDGAVTHFTNTALSAAQIKAMVTAEKLGDYDLLGWVDSALGFNSKEIQAELAQGYLKGESYPKMVSRIANGLDLDKDKRRDLESVVKTYIQSLNVKAQEDTYEANKDVVKQVEWSAIMENGNTKTGRGTCPRCAALDGSIYKVGAYHPPCPLHVRCRCLLRPITKTWKELGFDVPEMRNKYKIFVERDLTTYERKLLGTGLIDMDYSEWWATQKVGWQNAAIGPIRAQMIRDHEIKFKDIIDSKGNLIPIKALN